VIQSARTIGHGVLDVGVHETVRIDAPFLQGHRSDEVGREPGLGLPRFICG